MGVKPSEPLEREYLTELIAKEREIQKEEDARRASNKRFKDRIEKLEARRDELLDLLEGREHEQTPLPLVSPGKKAAPEPLKWSRSGLNAVARTSSGTYCVEPNTVGGGCDVLWTPHGGKSKRIGAADIEAAGKEIAREDWLVRHADAILDNAGDGKLTGKVRAGGQEIDVTPGRGGRGRKALPPKGSEGRP
jgi:hypothetical protein